MGQTELHLPPDAQFAGLARLVVGAAARKAGMSEVRVQDLKIAVNEAVVVALEAVTDGGPLVLSFGSTSESVFEVRVVAGQATLPLEQQPTGAVAEMLEVADVREEVQEAGLGATVLRSLADDVVVMPGEGGGSSLRFTFALQADAVA